MTADVEMLPLPDDLHHHHIRMGTSEHHAATQTYARANVAHATAAKDAVIVDLQSTIEALRAEVETWKNFARGNKELLQESIYRAERLAEALRDLEVCANTVDHCYTRNPGNFAVALRELRESAERSRAALHPTAAQENDDA